MAKKIRVWDGSAWQDVAPALPYTAVHSAQASMPSTAVDGQIWLDTDASVPSTTVTRWYKLPSAGTTTLSGNDDNSIPLAYTPGYEQVFLNGTLLSRSAADYTATTGTSVVLSSAIVAGDIVEIICPLQITTTDTYTQSAADNKFVQNTGYAAAGKNYIINGDFGIWQRGTTVNLTASTSTYLADRFSAFMDSNAGTFTYSRQTFTPGTAPVAGYEGQYFARLRTGGNCNFAYSTFIENVRTLAGQTVTVSFWAKSSTTKTFLTLIRQYFGTGGSGIVDQSNAWTATTTWQRFTFTYVLPSISGKTVGANSYVLFQLIQYASSTGNYDVDFWGVQVEAGSNATAFQTATGTLQGELAACQRYYYRKSVENAYDTLGGVGVAASTTSAVLLFNFPVKMRTSVSAIDHSGAIISDGFNYPTVTSLALYNANSNNAVVNFIGSGYTQYRPYMAVNYNNTSAYIGFSAEL